MASTTTVAASVTVNDGVKDTVKESASIASLAIGPGINGKRETVSLTGSAFTALSPPSGAKGVMIVPGTTPVSLTLKGITGDTGVAIVGSASNGLPILLPLGTTPSIGIANAGATASVEVIWF